MVGASCKERSLEQGPLLPWAVAVCGKVVSQATPLSLQQAPTLSFPNGSGHRCVCCLPQKTAVSLACHSSSRLCAEAAPTPEERHFVQQWPSTLAWPHLLCRNRGGGPWGGPSSWAWIKVCLFSFLPLSWASPGPQGRKAALQTQAGKQKSLREGPQTASLPTCSFSGAQREGAAWRSLHDCGKAQVHTVSLPIRRWLPALRTSKPAATAAPNPEQPPCQLLRSHQLWEPLSSPRQGLTASVSQMRKLRPSPPRFVQGHPPTSASLNQPRWPSGVPYWGENAESCL